MKRSSDRILTSHTGVLNLPPAAGRAAGPRGDPDLRARVLGRENVIAGTDCGMRGHPLRDWIKYRAMVEGAALASEKLWGRKAA